MVGVLTEPRNALIKQYSSLMAMSGARLRWVGRLGRRACACGYAYACGSGGSSEFGFGRQEYVHAVVVCK